MIAFLKTFFAQFFTWLRSVYSESDGSGSSTRIHMTLLILFVLGVGVSFAVSVHHKLITLEQFDSFLTSGATFIVTTCGALYGINKVSEYANSKVAATTVVPSTLPPVVQPNS
jgi:hypothetical protein